MLKTLKKKYRFNSSIYILFFIFLIFFIKFSTISAKANSFKIADLEKDSELLDSARSMADILVVENREIVETLMQRWMFERQECANV